MTPFLTRPFRYGGSLAGYPRHADSNGKQCFSGKFSILYTFVNSSRCRLDVSRESIPSDFAAIVAVCAAKIASALPNKNPRMSPTVISWFNLSPQSIHRL